MPTIEGIPVPEGMSEEEFYKIFNTFKVGDIKRKEEFLERTKNPPKETQEDLKAEMQNFDSDFNSLEDFKLLYKYYLAFGEISLREKNYEDYKEACKFFKIEASLKIEKLEEESLNSVLERVKALKETYPEWTESKLYHEAIRLERVELSDRGTRGEFTNDRFRDD